MLSIGGKGGDFPENQLTKNTVWTTKTFPDGRRTTFGGGTAIPGGGTPNTGDRMAFWPIPAEFNHRVVVCSLCTLCMIRAIFGIRNYVTWEFLRDGIGF